jgi:hypothetical protein
MSNKNISFPFFSFKKPFEERMGAEKALDINRNRSSFRPESFLSFISIN